MRVLSTCDGSEEGSNKKVSRVRLRRVALRNGQRQGRKEGGDCREDSSGFTSEMHRTGQMLQAGDQGGGCAALSEPLS